SLAMSPVLLAKYLAAARHVVKHLVLKPDGFDFAPYPAVTDTDRDRYCVERIIAFYERHRVDYADYFVAAWRFRHRDALGKPKSSLRVFAREAGRGGGFLAPLWAFRAERGPAPSAAGHVRAMWGEFPDAPGGRDEAGRDCERIRASVIRLRLGIEPRTAE